MCQQQPYCTIGQCIVHRGMPPQNNPYRGTGRGFKLPAQLGEAVTHVSGAEREAALRLFQKGESGDYTFWYAPAGGGANQITNPDKIMWQTMRKPQNSS